MIEVRETETFSRWLSSLRDPPRILLCGGDKGGQARDVALALALALAKEVRE